MNRNVLVSVATLGIAIGTTHAGTYSIVGITGGFDAGYPAYSTPGDDVFDAYATTDGFYAMFGINQWNNHGFRVDYPDVEPGRSVSMEVTYHWTIEFVPQTRTEQPQTGTVNYVGTHTSNARVESGGDALVGGTMENYAFHGNASYVANAWGWGVGGYPNSNVDFDGVTNDVVGATSSMGAWILLPNGNYRTVVTLSSSMETLLWIGNPSDPFEFVRLGPMGTWTVQVMRIKPTAIGANLIN